VVAAFSLLAWAVTASAEGAWALSKHMVSANRVAPLGFHRHGNRYCSYARMASVANPTGSP
jgi:hypothetical protein